MHRKKIGELKLNEYVVKRATAGFGTRPSAVIMRANGRRQYLIKGWNRNIGELCSEACATEIGKVLGFPAQEASLHVLSDDLWEEAKNTGLYHGTREVVMCKVDVRHRRDTSRNKNDLEEMLHGANLLELVLPGYSGSDPNKRRHLYTLDNIDQAIKYFIRLYPDAQETFMNEFFEMCVFDALIGGTERHDFNWGVLLSIPDHKYRRMVKLFDNGISLLWDINPRITGQLLFRHTRDRFINHGQSVIRGVDGHRLELFEVCVLLLERGYYNDIKLKELLKRLNDGIASPRLKHAIIDLMPIDDSFRIDEVRLGWIYQYVIARTEKFVSSINRNGK